MLSPTPQQYYKILKFQYIKNFVLNYAQVHQF